MITNGPLKLILKPIYQASPQTTALRAKATKIMYKADLVAQNKARHLSEIRGRRKFSKETIQALQHFCRLQRFTSSQRLRIFSERKKHLRNQNVT